MHAAVCARGSLVFGCESLRHRRGALQKECLSRLGESEAERFRWLGKLIEVSKQGLALAEKASITQATEQVPADKERLQLLHKLGSHNGG